MAVPMIAGLYPYARDGKVSPPSHTLEEIPKSLSINPSYRSELMILAGDRTSAEYLERFGLTVLRTFEDAPKEIHSDAAHKMKHWMCIWALEEFGEFLWVDWDTVMLRPPDDEFWSWARAYGTPKFIHIPNYWATVNCGVYYANEGWLSSMKESLNAKVPEPNDELLWASILPEDVEERIEYWWEDRVLNVWQEQELEGITENTYFVHIKELDWAHALMKAK